MTNVLDSISNPVLVAPMAGGPVGPEIVRAAYEAGSLGSLAVGTSPMNDVAQQMGQMEGVEYGLNLFHPQPPLTSQQREAARPVAEALGGHIGYEDYTFGWHEKLALAVKHENRPAMVWSMFGAPNVIEISRLHDAGIEVWTTVTTPEEAQEAVSRGVDVLCVQGPEAGGHRGVWDFTAEPDWRSLEELVAAVHAVVPDIALIAAGGVRTAADVAQALSWPGVVKVSCGSAFLLADEAGTSQWNRQLISSGGATVSTRAFSGRFARGLETEYTRNHPDIPAMYPHLNTLLRSRRAENDPEVAYCLVGIRPEEVSGGSVAQILSRLS